MNEFRSNRFEAREAAGILGSLADESLPPEVNEFAHFIASRLGSGTIIPQSLVLDAMFSIHDLKRGKDPYTDQPIESSLVGLEDEEYRSLLSNLPLLASKAFSDEFALEVTGDLVGSGLIVPLDAHEAHPLDPAELITEPITQMDTAYEQIIEDSKKRVAGLDWAHFGEVKDPEELLESATLLSLRNSPYNSLPINLLVDDREHEAGYLMELPAHMKRHVKEKYWYGMLTEVIAPEEAMFAKDHIFLSGVQTVAVANGVDVDKAYMYFSLNIDSPLNRAIIRMKTYLEENPGIFKKPGE